MVRTSTLILAHHGNQLDDTVSIVRGQHTIRQAPRSSVTAKTRTAARTYDGNMHSTPAALPTPPDTRWRRAAGYFHTYTEAAYDPIGHYRYTEPGGIRGRLLEGFATAHS